MNVPVYQINDEVTKCVSGTWHKMIPIWKLAVKEISLVFGDRK